MRRTSRTRSPSTLPGGTVAGTARPGAAPRGLGVTLDAVRRPAARARGPARPSRAGPAAATAAATARQRRRSRAASRCGGRRLSGVARAVGGARAGRRGRARVGEPRRGPLVRAARGHRARAARGAGPAAHPAPVRPAPAPGQRRKVDWVRDLASLDPHLVVDTATTWRTSTRCPPCCDALEPLLAIPGAFVMGSNDYFAPTPKNPARYLLPDARRRRRSRPPELPGASSRPRFRVGRLEGPDQPARRGQGRRPACSRSSASTTRTSTATTSPRRGADDARTGSAPVDLHLGVTHAPYRRVLDAMHADGADLVIAGHTHGGQLALPFYGALVTNCDLDSRRAKGLHGWPGPRPDRPGGAGSTWLHVSAGLGTSPYAPVRFACRPEATLLTLVGRLIQFRRTPGVGYPYQAPRGVAQLGSALRSGRRGRGFESRHPDRRERPLISKSADQGPFPWASAARPQVGGVAVAGADPHVDRTTSGPSGPRRSGGRRRWRCRARPAPPCP